MIFKKDNKTTIIKSPTYAGLDELSSCDYELSSVESTFHKENTQMTELLGNDWLRVSDMLVGVQNAKAASWIQNTPKDKEIKLFEEGRKDWTPGKQWKVDGFYEENSDFGFLYLSQRQQCRWHQKI